MHSIRTCSKFWLFFQKKSADKPAIFILREHFFLSKPTNNPAIFLSEKNFRNYQLRANSAPKVQLKSFLLIFIILFASRTPNFQPKSFLLLLRTLFRMPRIQLKILLLVFMTLFANRTPLVQLKSFLLPRITLSHASCLTKKNFYFPILFFLFPFIKSLYFATISFGESVPSSGNSVAIETMNRLNSPIFPRIPVLIDPHTIAPR